MEDTNISIDGKLKILTHANKIILLALIVCYFLGYGVALGKIDSLVVAGTTFLIGIGINKFLGFIVKISVELEREINI